MKLAYSFVIASMFVQTLWSAILQTEVVDGIEWTFAIVDGKASVGDPASKATDYTNAIPDDTKGDIVIPSTLGGCPVTAINDFAFQSCADITSVVIPEGVTIIGHHAFDDCIAMTAIEIPEGVTEIGGYAFEASGLTSITFPASLSLFSQWNGFASGSALKDCSALTTIRCLGQVPEGLEGLFGSRSSPPAVTIKYPPELEYDWRVALTQTFPSLVLREVVNGIEWSFMIVDEQVFIGNGEGNNATKNVTGVPIETQGAITIPSELGGFPVTGLSAGAFRLCESLTSVEIPEGVTTIGDYAFDTCRAMQSIAIPSTVTNIGENAFWGCSSLISVAIPGGVTEINERTFYGCSSLTEVVIPEGVTEIGSYAFWNCSALTEVIIPDGVTSIGNSAFAGCSALTEMVIPEGVTEIGGYAFNGCSALTEVIIPESVTEIDGYAFSRCSSLTSVVIPEGVTEIDGYVFSGCSSLTSVVIPEGVTSIGNQAFKGCSSLTSVVIPASVTSIGHNAFSGCPVETVVFRGDVPDGVSASGFPLWLSAFPQEYGAAWELALSEFRVRYTVMDVLVPGQVQVEARAETPTTKTIKVTYTVRSELPSVKVRAVAWKDGVRSFANIVPVRTGEGVPRGESVTTNEEHTFVWEVASDWATDLDKVAVEILVQEGTLLPQELITIPATKSHKAMTITRNALADSWLFDALVWCYAEGDTQLVVNNGRVSVNGTDIAKDDKLPTGTNWDGSYNSGWKREATALLNYLYGKMGYKVLAGEDLEYAETATRLDFADWNGDYPHRQVSVKIEEGE